MNAASAAARTARDPATTGWPRRGQGERMKNTLSPVLLALFALSCALAPAVASAQPATGYRARVARFHERGGAVPLGWYMGARFEGVAVWGQIGGPEALDGGSGGAIYGGVHLLPSTAIELSFKQSLHNPLLLDTWYGLEVDYLVLDGLSVGGKFYLGAMRHLVTPYLVAGVGAYALSSTYFGIDSRGTGFHLAADADIWPAPWLAIGLRLTRRSITFSPPAGGKADFLLTTAGFGTSVEMHF